VSLAAVVAVSLVVWVLESFAPVVSLGVLYLFAVLPVAALWGLPFAIPVSIVSMLAFNWLFLPPTHTLRLADSENWVALAVYLVTAVLVSELSARARRRAAEAEQRGREAVLAADVSALFLDGYEVEPRLGPIASVTARALGIQQARISLDPGADARDDEVAVDLVARERAVGRLFVGVGARPDPRALERVRAGLASLLATAIDRELLAEEAHQAEALRRSEAAKTAVLRAVSHDLRSPITALRTASEVLAGTPELADEERAELVESVLSQARRLERLVEDLLALSRLEAGAATPGKEVWTVDGLLARVLETVSASERVEVELPEDAPSVDVDAGQIERALVNVLENALRFSPGDESIVVSAVELPDEVRLTIDDHGPGVPAHERERIFEPFVRGETMPRDRGSGLGLAIARGFVALNGGRLWVEAGDGGGARFVLALPIVALPAEVHA